MSDVDLKMSVDHRSAVPLYEQICQQIREKIESRQLVPGASLPTTYQLREQLLINAKTAQQAMATLAREGYVIRQARRGTTVRGIPRRGVVGIYTHLDLLSQDGIHEYYRLITGNLGQQLDEQSRVHRLYLGSLRSGVNAACEDLLQHLSSGALCGVVLVNSPPHLDELVRVGRQMLIPVVALSGSGEVDYSARVDHLGYVRVAAKYLLQQGCQRVGVIYNRFSLAFQELGIAQSVLNQAGYLTKPDWVLGWSGTQEGGYEAAQRMPLAELDGLIVEDDVMAIGVDRFLAESKIRVPDDLRVTTFWNRGSRLWLNLPFTRFEIDTAKQARLGLELVQEVIMGKRIAEPHIKIAVEHSALNG
jgi:DNA-binding LacI/PurR family transcriptional regulator